MNANIGVKNTIDNFAAFLNILEKLKVGSTFIFWNFFFGIYNLDMVAFY